MAHMMLTLCAIGCTGVGKSSLCNLLSGSCVLGGEGGCDAAGGFGISSGIDASTQQTETGVYRWLRSGEPVKLIDTPGIVLLFDYIMFTSKSKAVQQQTQTWRAGQKGRWRGASTKHGFKYNHKKDWCP